MGFSTHLRATVFALRFFCSTPSLKRDPIASMNTPAYTPEQQRLVEAWEYHMKTEFQDHDASAAADTMTPDAHGNHVAVITGGVGREAMRAFYRDHFVSKMPPDISTAMISRTVGQDRVIDELIMSFTHTVEIDWILPGIKPTGRRVEVPIIVLVQFAPDGQVAHEHIYWDQATILVQIGLLDPATLPIHGAEQAQKIRDPKPVPSNQLIHRGA